MTPTQAEQLLHQAKLIQEHLKSIDSALSWMKISLILLSGYALGAIILWRFGQ